MPQRIHVDLCPVDCLNKAQALDELLSAMSDGRRLMVAPVNAATVVAAHRSPELRVALNKMDLLIPDGFYLQLAARLAGQPTTTHVPTVPLTFNLLESLARKRGRVFMLGATREVVQNATDRLNSRFAGVVIAGTRDGYFNDVQEKEIVSEINAVRPHLLMIGISSPKRELFMARHRSALNVPVTIGVGGMIDILGGKTAEGPDWLRRFGMMWFYRFLQEPRRMWKRYTIINSLFIAYSIRHAVGRLMGVRE